MFQDESAQTVVFMALLLLHCPCLRYTRASKSYIVPASILPADVKEFTYALAYRRAQGHAFSARAGLAQQSTPGRAGVCCPVLSAGRTSAKRAGAIILGDFSDWYSYSSFAFLYRNSNLEASSDGNAQAYRDPYAQTHRNRDSQTNGDLSTTSRHSHVYANRSSHTYCYDSAPFNSHALTNSNGCAHLIEYASV